MLIIQNISNMHNKFKFNSEKEVLNYMKELKKNK